MNVKSLCDWSDIPHELGCIVIYVFYVFLVVMCIIVSFSSCYELPSFSSPETDQLLLIG